MVRMNIFNQTQARKVVNQKGEFSVIEYVKDLSVTPATAASAYFMGQMGVRKRQVVANLNNQGIPEQGEKGQKLYEYRGVTYNGNNTVEIRNP